jgi:UDP-N-acetylglucosamine transferase subunit ALG13
VKVVGVCGTHHQPFDRLVRALDALAREATGDVWIQYGASTPPTHADGARVVARGALQERIAGADVVVTHGGPGAIWDALDARRATVVVPRRRRYGEHVDDHQVAFARHLERHGQVIVVDDVALLPAAVRAAAERPIADAPVSHAQAAIERIGASLDALVAQRGRP